MSETYLKDPEGLLSRAPELEGIARANKAVAAALARGDAHALYRTLRWERFRGRLRAHQSAVDQLLGHRRLFIAPIKGTPTLQTVNGIGGSLYGSSDRDQDGTYVSTHFAVLVFVPVFPVAQYLVRDGDGAKGRSWYFIGKVPMSTPLWLWNRLLVAGVFATMGLGAFQAFYSSRHHDVHFVNGLTRPVHVQAAEKETDVLPHAHQTLSLPTGTQTVRITYQGKEVEKGSVLVKAGTDVQIWNVLGAAPVVRETVFYTQKNAKPPDTPPRSYCGETSIVMPSAEYVFTDPPSTLSMPENQSITSRQAVLLAPGTLEWCLAAFTKPGKGPAAEALARGLIALDDSVESFQTAVGVMRLGSPPAAALSLIKQGLGRHPDSVNLHRVFQSVAKEAGQDATLLDEYRARRDANPDSADAAYLYARLLPRTGSLDDVRQLVARFPDHVASNRLAAFALVRSLEFKEALPVLERIKSLDKEEWTGFIEEHVAALAAIGRREEALQIANEGFVVTEGDRQLRMAALVSWLGAPESPGEALLARAKTNQTPDLKMEWRLRYWTAKADAAIPKGAVARLQYAAHYQPKDALDQLATMKVEDVSEVGAEVLVLLDGEALRAHHAGAAAKLEKSFDLIGLPQEGVKAYLGGGPWTDSVDEMPLYLHAALHAARARAGLGPAGERKRLIELAKQCDPVGGFTRKALEAWPSV